MGARRRTLRARLALLYGGLFLASSVAVLALVDALLLGIRGNKTTTVVPAPSAPPAPILPPGGVFAGHPHGVSVGLMVSVSVAALPFLVAGSFWLGWWVAGRVLRPLRTIMATANDISASNLHERLSLEGPYDEFRQLGETLDDLFARLESSFELQRHFVANASHELRTPLTAERTLLQVALADPEATAAGLRSTCEELLALSRQQERLIEALLTLASSEREVERWEAFDLAAIADRVISGRRHEADRRGLQLETRLAAAPSAGDPDLVEILVANLVDNAIRHNVDGGRIEVATGAAAARATLWVVNTGAAIPAGEVARLFQPFQRLGRARPAAMDGHGLGLAIVAAIAKAHRATVAGSSRPGGGLAIEVTFLGGRPEPASHAVETSVT